MLNAQLGAVLEQNEYSIKARPGAGIRIVRLSCDV